MSIKYDANGRLSRVYLPGNVDFKYFYDANGNLVRRESDFRKDT
ncbi:RHS repeat domain-containing protein [Paenibacillus sp. S-12]